jgi:hypothetical protein
MSPRRALKSSDEDPPRTRRAIPTVSESLGVTDETLTGFNRVDPLQHGEGESWVAVTPDITDGQLRELLQAVKDLPGGWAGRARVLVLDRPAVGSESYERLARALIGGLEP